MGPHPVVLFWFSMWNYQLDFWASTKGHPVHTLDVNSVTLDQSVASPLNHNGDGTLLSSPIETANRRVPSFSDLEFLPGFQSSWGTPHHPVVMDRFSYWNMVTWWRLGGTRAPTQVNLPPVAAQWADREDRRRCLENFRMPIAEKVDTSDFYSDIALDFYEKWYFLTIY